MDEGFRNLTPLQPSGQALFLYLLTCPHTRALPGLIPMGEMSLAEELGWSLKAFREAFAEAFREGMVEACWKARLVWLKNAVKYNKPESPNVVRSWAKHHDDMPECELLHRALSHIKQEVEALGEGYAKAFREAFGEAFAKPSAKAMPNQEQEQEQEKHIVQQRIFDARDTDIDEAMKVIKAWRRHHPRALMKNVKQSKEYRLVQKRLAEGFTATQLVEAVEGCHRSPWHCGENPGRKKYQSLTLIMRDSSKVESFLAPDQEQSREPDQEFEARREEFLRLGQFVPGRDDMPRAWKWLQKRGGLEAWVESLDGAEVYVMDAMEDEHEA